MNDDWVRKAEVFLTETFRSSPYLQADPAACAYRLEHSYRVANIGKEIAQKEGFDPAEMVVACLLHDISYCGEFRSSDDRRNHGRLSAGIVRPFLTELGLPSDRVNEICYGIAIHVDDTADFEGTRTAFAETISDADNIDRFDVYRIYENLEHVKFHTLSLEEKKAKVHGTLEHLRELRSMKLATKTACEMWQQRIDFYISFYERLGIQFDNSSGIME